MHPPSSSILRETQRASDALRDQDNQHRYHLYTQDEEPPREERAAQSRLSIALGHLTERWRRRPFGSRQSVTPSGL